MNTRNDKDILLVDDDVWNLNIFKLILETAGFDVIEATDGIKALECMETCNFRMVITDFDMPGMNGVELAAAARERHPQSRVVMMTGHDFLDVAEDAASAGISEIFTKPVEIERLIVLIESLISHNRALC